MVYAWCDLHHDPVTIREVIVADAKEMMTLPPDTADVRNPNGQRFDAWKIPRMITDGVVLEQWHRPAA
jgi:hypothetical protein